MTFFRSSAGPDEVKSRDQLVQELSELRTRLAEVEHRRSSPRTLQSRKSRPTSPAATRGEAGEGTSGEGWRPPRRQAADGLFWAIIGSVSVLAVVHLVLTRTWMGSPVLFEAPWLFPVIQVVYALVCFCVAFLALGRYRVLRDAASYWIGVGFAALWVGNLFYILAWPGLLPGGRSIIARLPGTAAWMSVIAVGLFGTLMIVAALARSPNGQPSPTRRTWAWRAVAVLLGTGLSFCLAVVVEQRLPVLVRPGGTFTPLLLLLTWGLALLAAAGAALLTRRYLQTGDRLLGYVALLLVAFTFVELAILAAARRYSLLWYWDHLLGVAGALAVLFGLLADYVRLFRRERERTTEVEESNARLVTERNRLAAVLENLPVGVWIADERGRLLGKNAQADRIWAGAAPSPSQAVAEHPQYSAWYADSGEQLAPEDYPMARALQSGQRIEPVELRIRRFDGSEGTVLVSAAPIHDAANRLAGVVGINVDISERKRSEEALRESREDLSRAQAVAHIGSWRSDAHSGEIRWSEENYRLFGVPPGTPMDHEKFMALVHPDDRAPVERAWAAALRGEIPYDIEHRIVVEGVVRWMHERAEMERDSQGVVRSGFGTTQDVTDRKRLEEEVARASRAKSEFLAHMSHEIRTPLSAIIGLAEVLGPRLQDGQNRQFVDMIHESSRSLLVLIGDILDFARIESGRVEILPKEFPLRDLLHKLVDSYAPLAQQQGLPLTLGIEEGVPQQAVGDADRLSQVIRNLLSNALKYTERGRVEVRAGWQERAGQTAMLQVEVADTGVGIPPESLSRLFQPFSRLHREVSHKIPEGTGLGLAICKHLVELLGGEIGVESRPGVGSTFRFSASLQPAGLRASAREIPEKGGNRQADALHRLPPSKVLLAEDNRMNQTFLKAALEEAGHRVKVAGDGQQAVEALRNEAFDLVLMDIQMPVLNGVEATRLIRQLHGRTARVPIIALTAFAVKGDEERLLAVGVDGYVSKPVDFGRLAEEIRRVRRNRPSRGTRHE